MISEVYNIDCLEYMRTLPDKYFDLAIADPPYGSASGKVTRIGGTWAAKYGKKIVAWDYAPGPEFFKELMRVSKDQIIWGANYFDGMPATKGFIVWDKLRGQDFSMAMAEYAWTSFDKNAKIVRMMAQAKKNDDRFHPTQKPVDLYAWILKNYAIGGGQNI